MSSFALLIVDQESQIYRGQAIKIHLTSVNGPMELRPGHAPLLAKLVPAPIWITKEDGEQKVIVSTGGTLEALPEQVIILLDTALRAEDLDESRAVSAKKAAETALRRSKFSADKAIAMAEIEFARAQLKVIKSLLKR